MAFKIDIAVKEGKDKGKTFHLESESQVFIGMKLGDTVHGKDIKPELEGCEFIITGASDNSGFPTLAEIEGTSAKRLLLKYGKGMKKRYPHGLRLRKRVHGNILSGDITQVNLALKKQGDKLLGDLLGKPVEAEGEKTGEEKSEESKNE